MQSGALEELSGDFKRDSQKIQEFFHGYGMSIDEPAMRSVGEGLYRGAFEGKKKREKELLPLFFKFLKEAKQALDSEKI